MTVVVTTNLPDFRRQLAEVERRTRARIVRRALRDCASVFLRFARNAAPVLKPTGKFNRQRIPGALKRGIYVGRGRDRERGVVRMFVGVRSGRDYAKKGRGDPFYWRFLEAGWIPRGPGKKLKGGERSRALQRRRLISGGATRVQYPFLAPAFSRGKGDALQAFNARMNREFSTVAKGIR